MNGANKLTSGTGAPSRPPPTPRAPRSRRRAIAAKVAAWTAVCLVAALTAGALTAYEQYRHVWHSIKRVRVIGAVNLGVRPPVFSTTALNILVIGSDSRSGRNARFGAGILGQRSDTIMILHVSPGRRRATVLSIPRDSVVPVFGCPREHGFGGQLAAPGQVEQINASFAFGGPGCLWKTVEQLTQIRLDHFVELNFTGFEKVINDIGGVSICLPWSITDPLSGLRLAKGPQRIRGAQALAFWRVRYIGQGSDLERIQRDQYLMASLVRGVSRTGLLGSPARIYSVLTDAASAMTTDSGLSPAIMIKVAESMRGLSVGAVQFIQVPTVAYPPDTNWVQWAQPQSRRLFTAIARDHRLPRSPVRRAAARGRTTPALAAVQARHRDQHYQPPAPAAFRAAAARTAAARAAASARSSAGGLTQIYGGITATANSCGDAAAFAGPDGHS